MYDLHQIKQLVITAIKEVTGITISNHHENLLSRKLGIMPADFLYIFDILSKIKTKYPLVNIFIDHGYQVMTVENLATTIYKLQ